MKSKRAPFFSHETLEKNVGWLILATIAVVSIAGLVQIVPLFFQHSTTTPVQGVEPYTALRLAGRDVYIREGCVGCHSQQVRTLAAEVQRYGHYSEAGEGVYDRPFLWGSKRTRPDPARVGGRYSDDWHRVPLNNPRDGRPIHGGASRRSRATRSRRAGARCARWACPIPTNRSRRRPVSWPARPKRMPWWPTSRAWGWR